MKLVLKVRNVSYNLNGGRKMSQITGTGDGSVKGLQAVVKDSPELQELFKKDPVKALA